MPKSPDAFRTISEVAEWLGVQAHVLRFWESKFSQVKPIKRAGGRRYYRPTDMLLLGGIKKLLHDDGMTIKGAQKLLREKGNAFVADLSQPLDDLTVAVIEGTAEDVTDQVEAQDTAPQLDDNVTVDTVEAESEATGVEPQETAPPETEAAEESDPSAEDTVSAETASSETDTGDGADEVPVMPSFRAHARSEQRPPQSEGTVETDGQQREKFEVTPPEPKETPKPRVIDVGPLPELADFPDQPSILSSISQIKSLSADDAAAIQPLLARLTRLRASMSNAQADKGKD